MLQVDPDALSLAGTEVVAGEVRQVILDEPFALLDVPQQVGQPAGVLVQLLGHRPPVAEERPLEFPLSRFTQIRQRPGIGVVEDLAAVRQRFDLVAEECVELPLRRAVAHFGDGGSEHCEFAFVVRPQLAEPGRRIFRFGWRQPVRLALQLPEDVRESRVEIVIERVAQPALLQAKLAQHVLDNSWALAALRVRSAVEAFGQPVDARLHRRDVIGELLRGSHRSAVPRLGRPGAEICQAVVQASQLTVELCGQIRGVPTYRFGPFRGLGGLDRPPELLRHLLREARHPQRRIQFQLPDPVVHPRRECLVKSLLHSFVAEGHSHVAARLRAHCAGVDLPRAGEGVLDAEVVSMLPLPGVELCRQLVQMRP
ncbi:hypothetical protein GCM10009565_52030 [Amycolatopsis albidoflavus]